MQSKKQAIADSNRDADSPAFAPSISLPKGGGAIRGIGEKFGANAATGTGALSVPLALSSGRSGFGPQLTLSYDSGAGNGPFGLGWSLGLPAITRKTDQGLPRYLDENSDVFIISGAEDLVPLLVEAGGQWQGEPTVRTVDGVAYRIQDFRPRIEGLFARIEHWTNLQTGASHWRSISRDNITSLYGENNNSRIFDPADPDPEHPGRVFSWLISESYDDKGNVVVYEYKEENTDGVHLSEAHERNRTFASRSAGRYLKRIRYGNRISRLVEPDAALNDWMFEAVFDYGEHDADNPSPNDGGVWLCRHDPFSGYRAGFEVRSYRLCQRVLMFHHFPDEEAVGENCLVRSTDFVYRNNRNNPDDLRQGHPVASFLASITQNGYRRAPGGYLRKSLPSIEFEYSQAVIQDDLREVDGESIQNLPYGIDGVRYRWLDLDGEGVAGIVTEQGNGWFYKRNISPFGARQNIGNEIAVARFSPLELVATKPSLSEAAAGSQQFLDLAGNGQIDLVQFNRPVSGYFERNWDEGWSQFVPFEAVPSITVEDRNVRFVDLTGDGHADILITEDDVFIWYPSLAEAGFGSGIRVAQALDEEDGPRLLFADSSESVYLADLSGDGLTDLVRIRNSEVCYWPNLGYGHFGAKVTMDNSPWFAEPELFSQKRIHLADIDGSGITDIIYLGGDRVSLYFNQSGNSWSEERVLTQFPGVDSLSSVAAVDLLGTGTACLVWSSSLPGEETRSMRYVDLMGSRKPNLLVRVTNNLGAETHIRYAPSTSFYMEDKFAGTPWLTRLPFPVHVVERIETLDHVSRNRFVTRYTYHHGYFDGIEREFRGFGMVEQLDTEELAALSPAGTLSPAANLDAASHVPPVLTRTWFHTGALIDGVWISRQFEEDYYREGDAGLGEEELNEEQIRSMLLDDTVLPDSVKLPDGSRLPWSMSAAEALEACRALKGSILRQEVYALDGTGQGDRPYRVSEHNYTIELLQPREGNLNAVLFSHPRESVDFQYERRLFDVDGRMLADPRVTHSMTLDVDVFGNVTESVSIGYGRRRADPNPLLTGEDREKQARTLITLTANRFTNAVMNDDSYRAPVPAEARTYELFNLQPVGSEPDVTNLFRFEEMLNATHILGDGLHDIPYENVFGADVEPGVPRRRLIEHLRSLYRRNDLGGSLPLGQLESLALPFESYRLAFTPGLVSEVYGNRVSNEMLLNEGRYVHSEGDANWWIPSGRVFFSPGPADSSEQELSAARTNFFLPRRFVDPFDNSTTVLYDASRMLLIETRDALGNTVRADNDYRVMQPRLITDLNGNRSAAAFDALGMVVGTALMGKENEAPGDSLDDFDADLNEETIIAHVQAPFAAPHAILGRATTRLLYDLGRYQRTSDSDNPQPSVVYALTRETHDADLPPDQLTRIQHSFSYTGGLGDEIQKKIQAEPGPVDGVGDDVNPRWVGTGWTIFNNKGKPVRQYEPFFSATHEFEFARMVGVSPILFYDPVGRVVATLNPNHTWEKTIFDPWHNKSWDVNDTVLQVDPTNDPEVSDFFRRLDAAEYLPVWHTQRIGGQFGETPERRQAEQRAAQRTALHADTPSRIWLDTLGRPVLTVADNRFERQGAVIEERYATRVRLDIEGNQRSVSDARGRVVMRYDYDVLGHQIHSSSMEAGERWMLNDVSGAAIRAWDSRGHVFRTEYDELRRSAQSFVTGAVADDPDRAILFKRTIYGEGQGDALNHRGRVFQCFDGAGVVTSEAYDFKGNLLRGSRQLLVNYRDPVDWSANPELESEVFTSSTSFDALNRPVMLTTPDESRIHPAYNEANLLERVEANLRGADVVTTFVSDIDYSAKGQRELIEYGNGVRTTYEYDHETFRLTRLQTLRGAERLQDLSFTYDPASNITDIRDDAQQTIYFNNQVFQAHAEYTYDAIYRLIEAHGREHVGQVSQPQTSWNDEFRVNLPHPNDGQAMRPYTERYEYDEVGNILRLVHQATSGNWTRTYAYNEPSLSEPALTSNRLSQTELGDMVETFAHDSHGNMTRMPHLPLVRWNYLDHLEATSQQVVNDGGTPETTYYVYDAAGQRVRKVTERHAELGHTPTRRNERISLGGFEIYREYEGDGAVTALERETLHLMDGEHRLALVDSRTQGNDGSPAQLIRYQLGNQVGSSSLELDAEGAVITYEEYHPYGTTAYQAGRSAIEVSLKRYRYTGKERDEETGLNYHGARYYAPWLARWTAADALGIEGGLNLYSYVGGRPITYSDPSGFAPAAGSEVPETMYFGASPADDDYEELTQAELHEQARDNFARNIENFEGHEEEFKSVLEAIDLIGGTLGEQYAYKIFTSYGSDRFQYDASAGFGKTSQSWLSGLTTSLGAAAFARNEEYKGAGEQANLFLAGIILHEYVHTLQRGYTPSKLTSGKTELYEARAYATEFWFLKQAGGHTGREQQIRENYGVGEGSTYANLGADARAAFAASFTLLMSLQDRLNSSPREMSGDYPTARAADLPDSIRQLSKKEANEVLESFITAPNRQEGFQEPLEGIVRDVERSIQGISKQSWKRWGEPVDRFQTSHLRQNLGELNETLKKNMRFIH
jgi:RHS repeat-associated protein